ncbi:MAG: polysaccharide deacetylase family protein [Bacteroidales bacterium]|nr:polysaccharide deacetylase family protein [Bacteroidales bacterium]
MKIRLILITFLIFPNILNAQTSQNNIGFTEILKWAKGMKSAVSITYDGGTVNQFRVALPIMNDLDLKSTFFIVTGDITGSSYLPKFIGRSIKDIVYESKIVPLNDNNFFERATAVRYLGYESVLEHHTKAGDFFELEKFGEAYSEIDMAYMKSRRGEYDSISGNFDNKTVDISWDQIKEIASQGHEFASHSISHPQLAIYDEKNIRYELEKSKQELMDHLGEKHAFSLECPYGTENKRVIKIASSIYPALRNRMPEVYLEEMNRWDKNSPTTSKNEYVQWQRGPKSNTSLFEMKSWIDTSLKAENIWLILVFHGIEGIGFEPISENDIRDYFEYIKTKENEIWVATFQDVTKYIRERMNTKINSFVISEKQLEIELVNDLDHQIYDYPLTLKTYVPVNWEIAKISQADINQVVEVESDLKGSYITYTVIPTVGKIIISK